MNLLHVVSHLDVESSGPSYSVPNLSAALSRQEQKVTLVSLDRGRDIFRPTGVESLAFPQAAFPQKLGSSPAMRKWMRSTRRRLPHIIHSHGLWMMPNLYSAGAASHLKIPHIIAPRGTLDPAALQYSRYQKKLFMLLGQRSALKTATAIHATSLAEAEHVRSHGITCPIILSKNGIDIPHLPINKDLPPTGRTLLYLGRLHPKKGLDMLFSAWERLSMKFPEWNLKVVGEGQPRYEDELRRLVKSRRLQRIAFEGPKYGEKKIAEYASADLFVLPTKGENFGMVVAEALAAGTPVVCTSAAPWADLSRFGAGWTCSLAKSPLRANFAAR